MAPLTSSHRKSLPSSEFGIPSERKYPMPDKSHAANAKARATQQENAGRLSPSEANHIRAMADRKLNDFYGGMADHNLALHAHHAALSNHFKEAGNPEAAGLHHGIAEHHLKMAEKAHDLHEHFKEAADIEGAPRSPGETDAAEAKGAAELKSAEKSESAPAGGHPVMLMGAAKQLHKAGHITTEHHERIKRSVVAKPKSRPFGSLAGAGHYIGDVDAGNSGGTVGNA